MRYLPGRSAYCRVGTLPPKELIMITPAPFRHHRPSLARTLLLAIAALGSACSGTSSPTPPAGDGSAPSPRWAAAVGGAGTLTQTFDDASWSTRSITGRDLYAVTCVG